MPNPHPIIVHFPIALFILSVICEVIAYFFRSRTLSLVAFANSIAAASMAFVAVVTGLYAKELVQSGPAIFVLESHETMGYLVLATSLAFAALKTYTYLKQNDKLLTASIAIGLLGIVFTIVAAHEGGELVYKYGVGVDKTPPHQSGKYPYGTPLTTQPDSTRDASSTSE